MNEPEIVERMTLIAHHQAPEVAEPSEEPLDLPPAFMTAYYRRTIWHLATGVSTDHFAVDLQAFAQAVGAGFQKQIVLVLDRAGIPALVSRSRSMCIV